MALTINSYDSNSINTLFSSLPTSAKNGGTSTGLETMLTDYSSLKTGSYGKLLKSYYAKGLDKTENSQTDDTSKKSLSQTKADGESLINSAKALLTNGKDSVWKKVEHDDGSIDYDKDKILDSISDFIDSYNSMIKSGADSTNIGVLTQVNSMVNTTKNAYSTLGQIGISIDSNNKLSIDDKFFKDKANIETAKSLFYGNSSYASTILSKASAVKAYSENAISNLDGKRGYNNTGSYSLSTADVMSSFNTKT